VKNHSANQSSSTQRLTAHFSGNVQGVGFRYTTIHVAQRFDVTGYVRNLHDGRVELVAEGNETEVKQFLAAVQDAMSP
jgi:acylphosphatase